jgi:hypothetical protein
VLRERRSSTWRAAATGVVGAAGRRASQSQAPAATRRWAAKLAAHTFHSCEPSPAAAMRLLAITPTALSGDRLPALAPLATIRAVRKAGTPDRAPIVIAIGTTRATVGTAPGPSVETIMASAKRRTGTVRRLPPTRSTARRASASMVPLASEMANSSVTPQSVRKRSVGKPAATAAAPHPAANTPTPHASAMASRPTFRRDAQLSTSAMSKASRDQTAGDIVAGGW